jgi:hypothetical protein
MSRGRSAALLVALIVLTLLLGACSSGDSSAEMARIDRKSAAANRAAFARAKAVVARRQAAVAARRRANARNRSTTSTSMPATPTTIATKPGKNPSSDLSAVQRAVVAMNDAFRKGVVTGIAHSAASNFWVAAGSYTGDECASFASTRGRGLVSERIALRAGSLVSAPGWVDPVIGKVPAGRIYRVTIDETQTLVPTGQQRARTLSIHVTVPRDGDARFLLRCR